MEKTLTAIIDESFKIITKLTHNSDLLSVIGSWRDTMTDEEILMLLRDWNNTGTIWKQKIIEVMPNNQDEADFAEGAAYQKNLTKK